MQFVYEMFWMVFHIGNLQKAFLFFIPSCPVQSHWKKESAVICLEVLFGAHKENKWTLLEYFYPTW